MATEQPMKLATPLRVELGILCDNDGRELAISHGDDFPLDRLLEVLEFLATAVNERAALLAVRDAAESVRARHRAKAVAANFTDCGCDDCEAMQSALDALAAHARIAGAGKPEKGTVTDAQE